MSAGYIYVLINQSMPGLIKVGRTYRNSRERARELYSTGVPTPFEVAFEIFSLEHESIEERVHQGLASFRVSNNREFFRYPLKEAIELLLEINQTISKRVTEFVAESIFHRLIKKYPDWLDPSIADVRIVQTSERVWLEIMKEEEIAGYLKDQTIKRSDLAFITDGDYESKMFRSGDHISVNASKFVDEFGPYSIIMTTDLFHEEACKEIDKQLNPHRNTQNNDQSSNL